MPRPPKRRRRRPTRETPFRAYMNDAEKRVLLEALETCTTWNVKAAAAVLGLPLSTMKWKMQRYKIRRP
jgi:transcriptional regulator of acetoin/glycerol metabolism